jgi:hypothetical protein
MQELFAAMSSKFNQLIEDRSTNIGSGSHSRNRGPRINRIGSDTSGSTTLKIAKLDFPHYSGDEDPSSWICRVEQFFEFHGTVPEERLPLVAYHLDGMPNCGIKYSVGEKHGKSRGIP